MTNVLKLEVGKTYLDRAGNNVKITWGQEDPPYPFSSDTGFTFTSGGMWDLEAPSEHDLISEVITKEVVILGVLDLKVGGTYIDNRGVKVEIIGKVPDQVPYPFRSTEGGAFAPDGQCYTEGEDSPYDLAYAWEDGLTPHKWAKEIRAFADGNIIQEWKGGEVSWRGQTDPEWNNPDYLFRVKPDALPHTIRYFSIQATPELQMYEYVGLRTPGMNGGKLIRAEFDPNTGTVSVNVSPLEYRSKHGVLPNIVEFVSIFASGGHQPKDKVPLVRIEFDPDTNTVVSATVVEKRD